MYISKVEISKYKGFNEATIELIDGLNVILGHNNGGKSTVNRTLFEPLPHKLPNKGELAKRQRSPIMRTGAILESLCNKLA